MSLPFDWEADRAGTASHSHHFLLTPTDRTFPQTLNGSPGRVELLGLKQREYSENLLYLLQRVHTRSLYTE